MPHTLSTQDNFMLDREMTSRLLHLLPKSRSPCSWET